jgi:hypothetical protein
MAGGIDYLKMQISDIYGITVFQQPVRMHRRPVGHPPEKSPIPLKSSGIFVVNGHLGAQGSLQPAGRSDMIDMAVSRHHDFYLHAQVFHCP